MCSHPVYPRKTTDCPSRHFHGFPDTHATNGRATQIWHTRTENTGTMRESKLAFKKKGKKYDRTDSTDHTPYENRGLSAGIRTVDAMHRFHYEGYRRLQGCNKDVSQTQSRHLFRSRGRWRKNHWRDSCRPRRKTVAHLHTAVDPDARGRGIGSMLVGRVVETLRTIGLPKVAVGVPADNDAGNDFWERQGFAVRDDLVYRELPL